jgi:hypothetical protein
MIMVLAALSCEVTYIPNECPEKCPRPLVMQIAAESSIIFVHVVFQSICFNVRTLAQKNLHNRAHRSVRSEK